MAIKKENTTEKALVPADTTPAAIAMTNQEVPEFLRAEQGNRAGLEDMDQSDVALPRLGLCQDLTPQRKKSNANFIEGLECGQFFNTVTGQIYGDKVQFVPLFFFKSRIYFEDINKGGGMLCQSLNAKTGGKFSPESCETCKFASWDDPEGSKDGRPKCGLFFNYVGLLPNADLIAVSFKSTGLKIARQWNSLIRLTNLPMYAKTYFLDSIEMTKNNNTFSTIKVTPGTFVSPEFYAQAKTYFDALREKKIEVDTTGMSDDEGDDGFDTKDM